MIFFNKKYLPPETIREELRPPTRPKGLLEQLIGPIKHELHESPPDFHSRSLDSTMAGPAPDSAPQTNFVARPSVSV